MVSVPYEPWFRVGNVLRGKHLAGSAITPSTCNTGISVRFEKFLGAAVTQVRTHRSVSLDHRVLPSKTTLIFLLLTAIGVARIASTYRQIAQTSDETPNIACGMQYLDLGRYDYGAFHPPLARLAMAVGPYLYGARVAEEARSLAGRQRGPEQRAASGEGAGAGAHRNPAVLRAGLHGGVAVGSASCLANGARWPGLSVHQHAAGAGARGPGDDGHGDRRRGLTALYCVTRWVEEPTLKRSVLFGAALAMAFLTKFSSLLLMPVCLLTLTLLYRRTPRPQLGMDSRGLRAGLGRVPLFVRPHDRTCGGDAADRAASRQDSARSAARAGNVARACAADPGRDMAGARSRRRRAHRVPAGAAQLSRMVVFLPGGARREDAAGDSAAGAIGVWDRQSVRRSPRSFAE